MADSQTFVASRFTTRYNLEQDRIQLALALVDEKPIGLWLTQRLLTRLIPTLVNLLDSEKIRLSQNALEVHNIAQQHAQNVVETQSDAQGEVVASDEGLVEAIDLSRSARSAVLTFRCLGKQERYSLTLGANQLRSWLSILCSTFHKAEWDTTAFPTWVRSNTAMQEAAILH